MTDSPLSKFEPDYAVPPGETLVEILHDRGMSQVELAKRTGRHTKTINEIIKGKAPVNPETAIQFERVLGVPAHFWNNLEQNYREGLARIQEKQQLESYMEWLEQMPYKTLMKWGIIPRSKDKVAVLQEMLQFYGFASPSAWQEYWMTYCEGVTFRKSKAFEARAGALSAWLRVGQLKAESIPCELYKRPLFVQALNEARGLTRTGPEVFHPKLVEVFARAGVAVVFFPEISGARVSGATSWLNPKKGLIQLSLRHKSDDHLWFTFFHEAAHLLLHSKLRCFVDIPDAETDAVLEDQANEFSANLLIPPRAYKKFAEEASFTRSSISQFAESQGISQGIIVGRLQFDKLLPFNSQLNTMKVRFAWKEPVSVPAH